jgi:hypothetical protein
MKVEFNGFIDFHCLLKINGWCLYDKYDVNFDELDGKKRIIITREEDE